MNNTQVIAVDRLELLKNKVFDTLDVSEGTRREYFVRVDYFLRFTERNGLNEGSYMEYKRFLASNDTYGVSTKNKYLVSAKVFLDGLHRLRLIPSRLRTELKASHSPGSTKKTD